MRQDIYYDFDSDKEEFRDKFSENLKKPDEIWVNFSSAKQISIETLKQKLDDIKAKNPGAKVKVNLMRFKVQKGYIYDEREVEYYKTFSEELKKTEGAGTYIDLAEGGGFAEQVVVARAKIEEFVEKLNNTTIEQDGKQVPLSVAEKFMCVYRFASDRVYNMHEDFGDENMRNWVGLLSTEYAICSGFASLLKCLCDRVFSPEELKCFEQGSNVYSKQTGELLGGHANNLIIIKDPKYNLDGVYYCDACWDCKKSEYGDTNFAFFMLPISKIFNHTKRDMDFEDKLFIYRPYENPARKLGDPDSVFFIERDHAFNEFLYKRLGYKNRQEIYEKLGGDKLIAQREKEIKQYNENLKNQINEVFEKVCKQHNLEDILKIEILKYYPQSVYEKFPELVKVQEFFDNIKIEDFEKPEFVENVRALNDFINEHQDIHQRVLLKAKEVKLKISIEFSEFIKNNAYTNGSQYFSEFNEKYNLETKTKKAYKAQTKKILAKHGEYICPKHIPSELFYNGLKAIAKIEGISQDQISQFIKRQVEFLEAANQEYFGENIKDKQTQESFKFEDEFSK